MLLSHFWEIVRGDLGYLFPVIVKPICIQPQVATASRSTTWFNAIGEDNRPCVDHQCFSFLCLNVFFLDLLSLWMFVVPPCLHLLFLTKLSPPDLSDQRGKKHYDWNKVGAAANTARCQNSRNRKSFNFLWGELPIMCRGCFLITAQPEKGSWQNLFRAFSRHNFGKLLIDVFNILRMKKILTHQPT